MIKKYKIDPNEVTEFVTHYGKDITVIILEGLCNIETIYNNIKLEVEKGKQQPYNIQEKVEYRFKNTCNYPCVLLIISEIKEEDVKLICENYTIWDLNHIKPDTHYNYNSGTKKYLKAAA